MCSAFQRATVFSSAIIAISATTQPTSGAVWYVDQHAAGPAHNGTSWCSAFTELQDAISVASPGDDIFIAGGTYTPDRGAGQVAGDRTATFSLANSVAWQGGYAGCGAPDPNVRDVVANETVLDGDLLGDDDPGFVNYADNSFHVVTYADSNATGSVLDGLTVRGGNADGTGPAGLPTNQGGGVHIRNGNEKCLSGGPTLRNCTIEWNTAAHHGALNDHGLSTVIENCIIRNNHAEIEGGGLQIHSGSPTISGCSFIDNSSGGNGGGTWAGHDDSPSCSGQSNPTFTNCVFESNSALNGGGLYIDRSSPTLNGCVFDANRATPGNGGAIFNGSEPAFESGPIITQSSFMANTAWNHGGAIYNTSSSGEFRDILFDRNEAVGTEGVVNGSGGAVYSQGSDLIFERCEFRDSRAQRYGGAIHFANGIRDGTVIDSLFIQNSANAQGGAINIGSARNIAIIRSTFVGNQGQGGGAVKVGQVDDFQLANCGFYGNRASSYGGALYLANLWGVLVNVVASGNTANSGGDCIAIVTGADQDEPSHVELHNFTTFGNNSPTTSSGASVILLSFSDTLTSDIIIRNSIIWEPTIAIASEGFPTNIDVAFCNVSGGWPGMGVIDSDPQFANATGPDGVVGTVDDDFQLLTGSPSRDSGSATSLPPDTNDLDNDGVVTEPVPIDFLGQSRQQGNEVDMGAYEASAEPCPPGMISPTGQTPCTNCLDGSFQPDPGQSSCLPCEGCGGCINDICDNVSGNCGTGCPVPASSTWGLIGLALAVLVAGSILMQRTRRLS